MSFSHADEASVGEAHGNICISPDEVQNRQDMACQVKCWHQAFPTNERVEARRTSRFEKVESLR